MKDLIIEFLTSVQVPERKFSRLFLEQLGFEDCGCWFKTHTAGENVCGRARHAGGTRYVSDIGAP